MDAARERRRLLENRGELSGMAELLVGWASPDRQSVR